MKSYARNPLIVWVWQPNPDLVRKFRCSSKAGQKKRARAVLARPGLESLQPSIRQFVQRLDHSENDGTDERERSIRGNDVEFGGEIHGNCSRFDVTCVVSSGPDASEDSHNGTSPKVRAAVHPR